MTKNITIIGLGLIGGSLAKAYKIAHPHCSIIGIDASEEARILLIGSGTVDAAYDTVHGEAVAHAEIIIIATPPDAWEKIAQSLKALSLTHVTLIMDVGSIKAYANECFGALPHFVAAHPIAGSEFSGAAFSTGELFQGKRVILTPSTTIIAEDVERAQAFWELLQMRPSVLDDQLHDRIYAHVSHLPQFAAYAIARATLMGEATVADTSYLKFLRLAGSPPTLWGEIFQRNPYLAGAAENLLQVIGHMIAELRTGTLTHTTPLNSEIGLKLLPRIIASTIISAVTLEEKRLDIRMAIYAGSGLADMTHPAMTPPEGDLALISEHTNAVVVLLDAVEASLRDMIIALKQGDMATLMTHMVEAQSRYVQQL